MLFTSAVRALQGALALASVASAAVLPDLKGQPRTFELTLTQGKAAPDGFEREVILINDKFTMPLLEMNQFDEVEITVHNNLPFNTSIHYHGIEMFDTPWSDGMPGLSQRQIQPGATFVYKWTATQYGAFWYHAHQHGQVEDGMFGPLIIHPDRSNERPFALIDADPKAVAAMLKAETKAKRIMLSDWRHTTSDDNWQITVDSGIEQTCVDSILVNGKGRVNCWPAEKIASLLDAGQRGLLESANATAFTAKGCLPPPVIAETFARGLPVNLEAIPETQFDVCTETEGSHEVIEFKKAKCDKDGKWVAFDIISTFGLHAGTFSIDEHSLWVYAVDGAYIEPQKVEAISVFNGNRYSVMVKLEKPGDFTIRFASITIVQLISGYGTLRYVDGAVPASAEPSVAYINDAGDAVVDGVIFFSQAAMKMFPPEFISQTSDQTFRLAVRVAGQSYQWALNGTAYPEQLNNEEPLLFAPEPERHNGVTITTLNNTWIDLIFESTTFPMPPHPIHKHGNHMWIIGQGTGAWKWDTVEEALRDVPGQFNLVDPPKRDTFATPPTSTEPAWMAVRYHVNNPGAWFLHCHIQSHMLGGMGVAIQDGIDHWPTVPEAYLNMS